jgi:hypothetical protein
MRGRVRTRRERGVANDRFRVGMGMMRIRKDDAILQKKAETALAHAIQIAIDEVSTQLVDRDLQDELRWLEVI